MLRIRNLLLKIRKLNKLAQAPADDRQADLREVRAGRNYGSEVAS